MARLEQVATLTAACMPDDCCSSESSPKQALLSIGYNEKELAEIPDSSKLGVGCGFHLILLI